MKKFELDSLNYDSICRKIDEILYEEPDAEWFSIIAPKQDIDNLEIQIRNIFPFSFTKQTSNEHLNYTSFMYRGINVRIIESELYNYDIVTLN